MSAKHRQSFLPTRSPLLLTGATLVSIMYGSLPASADSADWKVSLVEGERRLSRKEYVLAEDCFRQAWKEARRSHASADETVLCMESLARVLQLEDLTEDSVPLYRKALKLLERAHGKGSDKLLPVLLALGEIQEAEGNSKAAIGYFSRAGGIVARTAGVQSFAYADCEHRLGRARFKAHEAQLAQSNYHSALLIMMTQGSLADVDSLEALIADYSNLLRQVYGEGKPLPSAFQSELWRDRVGLESRNAAVKASVFERAVSTKLADQANSRAESSGAVFRPPAGDASSASVESAALSLINKQRLEFYERMIAIDIKALGADHPSVARDLSGLASIYMSQNRNGDARPLLERARTIYEGAYGQDNMLYRRTEDALALIAASQGAGEGASPSQPLSLDFVKALPAVPEQARVLEVALRLNDLAFLSYALGKLEEADTIYHFALASTAFACGDESLLTATCLRDYSRVLRGLGRIEQAQSMEKDAELIARNARPAGLSR